MLAPIGSTSPKVVKANEIVAMAAIAKNTFFIFYYLTI
jgi:hypothetical protein